MKKQDIISSVIKKAPRSESKHEINIGASVTHLKFGQGVVTGYKGNENDLAIQINFSTHGSKWLLMEFAKLTKV
jgi:DNA helicase-2/ATP-dependent DNA helicase PcrA